MALIWAQKERTLIKWFAINFLLSKTEQQPITSIQAEIKHELIEGLSKLIDGSSDEDFALHWRKNNQKLTGDQIKVIKTLLDKNKYKVNLLSLKYCISLSLVYKIKHLSRDAIDKGPA